MKTLTKVVVVASLIAAPLTSYAQCVRAPDRKQVLSELVRLENAGYNPNDVIDYPQNLQLAELKVKEQSAIVERTYFAYGGTLDGTSCGTPNR